MPHYIGEEFFQKAILEKTATLSSKIFHVPQLLLNSTNSHNADCCIITETMWALLGIREQSFSIDVNDFGAADMTNIKRFILENTSRKCLSVSLFEEDETLEIIPSSDPEFDGDCSFNLDLSFEKELNDLEEDIDDIHSYFTFNVKHHSFEMPIFPNDLQMIFGRLPNTLTLMKRMKRLELNDPLLKSDGFFWKEEDCFRNDLHFNCDQMDFSNDNLPLESRVFQVQEKKKEMIEFETVLFPVFFPKENFPQPLNLEPCELVDYVCNEGILRKMLKEKVVSLYCESLLCDDQSLQDNSALSFFELNNKGESLACSMNEFFTQPILSFNLLERHDISQPDMISDPLQDLNINEKDLHLSSPCPLLAEKQLLRIQRKVWDKEKHFDEMQIPVPFIEYPKPPNLLDEAFGLLGISEVDIESLKRCMSWSIGRPSGSSPSSFVSHLPQSTDTLEQEPVELVERLPYFDFESQWECAQSVDLSNDSKDEQFLSDLQYTVISNHSDIQLLDPVKSFIQVRSRQKSVGTLDSTTDESEINKAKESAQPMHGIITPMIPNVQEIEQKTENIKTIQVELSDSFEEVLEYIQDFAMPYVTFLKKSSILSLNETFMDISVDKTNFLLKEYAKKNADGIKKDNLLQKGTDISTLQSLFLVYTLRSAADLVLHSCLETCISWITFQMENNAFNSASSLNEICKQLLQYQCQFHQKNILHPKLSTLCQEIGNFVAQYAGCKVLIIVPRENPKLLSVLQHVLSKTLKLIAAIIMDLRSLSLNGPTDIVNIAPHTECQIQQVATFSLIVVFDERKGKYFRNLCKDNDIAYFDLLTQYKQTSYVMKTKEDMKEFTSPFTMICSSCVTQYRQLVYLLEARHNILVIERDYSKLTCGHHLYFADLIVDISNCIVLLPLQEMNKDLNLEATARRFVALGMQFSFCFVILHGLSVCSSSPLDKETLTMIFNIQSTLSNLCGTYECGKIQFKMLYCLTEEEVANTIQSIAQVYLSKHKEQDLSRAWLSSDVTQNEEFLLQFACLSSFSAQVLLKSLTVKEVFEKSECEIKEIIPEMPEKVLMYLSQSITEWKSQNQQSPSISQGSKQITSNEKLQMLDDNLNSPTYSPLLIDSEDEPSLIVSSPNKNNDETTSNVIFSHLQPSMHKQLNYNDNYSGETFHSFLQVPCHEDKSESLPFSQPHMLNIESTEIQDSSSDSSYEVDNEQGVISNSLETKYCQNLYKTNKSPWFAGYGNNSCNDQHIDTSSTKKYSLETYSLKSLEDSTYETSSNVENCDNGRDVMECINNNRLMSHLEIDSILDHKTLLTNSSRQMDYLKQDHHRHCFLPFYNESNRNNTATSAYSYTCNDNIDLLHGKSREMFSLLQTRPNTSDLRILSNDAILRNDEPLCNFGTDQVYSHAGPYEHYKHYDKPFNSQSTSKSAFPKRQSYGPSESINFGNSYNASGVTKTNSTSNLALKGINVPYFDRFSKSHKYTPVQPVLPSVSAALHFKEGLASSRQNQSKLLASHYKTNAYAPRLSNSNFQREFGQSGHQENKNEWSNFPRPKICIGLATPLRKQNIEVKNLNEAQQSLSGEREASDSPPLDLSEQWLQMSQNNTNEEKLKRWNNRLLTYTGQHADSQSSTNGQENSLHHTEPALKKRKLQVVKKAGNNGQTILVFK